MTVPMDALTCVCTCVRERIGNFHDLRVRPELLLGEHHDCPAVYGRWPEELVAIHVPSSGTGSNNLEQYEE